MDHLFSSPEKATRRKKINGHSKNANATISSEEDMDVGESMFILAVAEDKN
jgi:centromere protein C